MANLIVESLYTKYGATAPGVKTQKRKTLVEHIDLSDKLGDIARPGRMRDESKICDIVASHVAYEEMRREIGYDDDYSLVFYLDDANAVNIQSIVDDINDEFSAKDMPNYAQKCAYTNSPAIEVQELLRSINAYIENESLTEARNPENDEVNAVIRKWANSNRNRLSKKDKEILDKNGLSLEDGIWKKGSKHIAGPAYDKDNGAHYIMAKDQVRRAHPDYDLKGRLSKKPQSYNDTEVPIASWDSSYVQANKDQPYTTMNARYRKDAKQKMSPNQFKSLQPYADEKKELRQNKEDSKYAYKHAKEVRAQAKDRLKKAVDYYNDDMSYASRWESDAANYKKDANRALQQAKEKHAAKKKNESLSLKEEVDWNSFDELCKWCKNISNRVGWNTWDYAAMFLNYLYPYLNSTQIEQAKADIESYANEEDED